MTTALLLSPKSKVAAAKALLQRDRKVQLNFRKTTTENRGREECRCHNRAALPSRHFMLSLANSCSPWPVHVLPVHVLPVHVLLANSSSPWALLVLLGHVMFSLGKSCSPWPVLVRLGQFMFSQFMFSLARSCSLWAVLVLPGQFMFSLASSCSL